MAAQTQVMPNGFIKNCLSKPPRLPIDTLQRAVSDLSLELNKENLVDAKQLVLSSISEVEDAKCECCGMCEDFTPHYINGVREKYCGKWVCGLCSVAIDEEVGRLGKDAIQEALDSHMAVCVRFNSVERTNPALFLANGMREILKKSARAQSQQIGPRVFGIGSRRPGILRTSSCIPAITKEAARVIVSNYMGI